MLDVGISLLDETRRLASRVELSAGLVRAFSRVVSVDRVPTQYAYRRDAVVASGPWRGVNECEVETVRRRALRRGSLVGSGASITIFDVPREVFDAFEGVRRELRAVRDFAEANEIASQPELVELARAATMKYHRSGAHDETLQSGIRVNAPNLPNVTIDDSSGRLVGLHCDNWFGAPLCERDSSPNRIAFNLGAGARYLLYVNLPLIRVWELAYRSSDVAAADLTSDLILRFADAMPDYPVTRVRIGPGEGYIAPTDNIIHDGSTQGGSAWDLYFTVVGRFAVSPPTAG